MPFAPVAPLAANDRFQQVNDRRAAMMKEMEERRAAMQKSREEMMKQRNEMWQNRYSSAQ